MKASPVAGAILGLMVAAAGLYMVNSPGAAASSYGWVMMVAGLVGSLGNLAILLVGRRR